MKKIWMEPKAQLAKFSANEYVAACSDNWLAKIVHKFTSCVAFIDNEINGFNFAGVFNPTTSWDSAMGENSLDEFNDVVSGSKGHKYDQALESWDEGLNDYWLDMKDDYFLVSKNVIDADDPNGWYATKDTFGIVEDSHHSAFIWYNNDPKKQGYYVASELRTAAYSA